MVEPLLDAVGGRERYRVFDVATGSEWTPRPPRAGACMPGLGFSADQLRRPQAGHTRVAVVRARAARCPSPGRVSRSWSAARPQLPSSGMLVPVADRRAWASIDGLRVGVAHRRRLVCGRLFATGTIGKAVGWLARAGSGVVLDPAGLTPRRRPRRRQPGRVSAPGWRHRPAWPGPARSAARRVRRAARTDRNPARLVVLRTPPFGEPMASVLTGRSCSHRSFSGPPAQLRQLVGGCAHAARSRHQVRVAAPHPGAVPHGRAAAAGGGFSM